MFNKWPSKEPAKLLEWVLWKKGYGPNPHIAGKIPKWWFSFLAWVNWRLKGHGNRPKGVPKKIPDWAWNVLAEVIKHVEKPIPPNQPSEIQRIGHLTGAMVAWGFYAGFSIGSLSPNDFVSRCKLYNIKAIALQAIPENDPYASQLRSACQLHGLLFGAWTNVPQVDLRDLLNRIQNWQPYFFQANIEGRWELGGTTFNQDGSVNNPNGCHKAFVTAFRQNFPTMPATIQTNWGGFEARDAQGFVIPGYDTVASKIYIDAKFGCQHEDYIQENPNLTPSSGDFIGHNKLEFPNPTSSLIGSYRIPVSSNLKPLHDSGRAWIEWIYAIEEATDEDWVVIKNNASN